MLLNIIAIAGVVIFALLLVTLTIAIVLDDKRTLVLFGLVAFFAWSLIHLAGCTTAPRCHPVSGAVQGEKYTGKWCEEGKK